MSEKRLTANDDLLGNGEDVFSGFGGSQKLTGAKPEKKRRAHDYVDSQGRPVPETLQVGGLTMRLKEEPEEERGWVNDQREKELEHKRTRQKFFR